MSSNCSFEQHIGSPKCAAITGVGSGHEPPLLYKRPHTVQRLTQPLAAKSKLYLFAVGLFALTEIGERRISGA